MTPLMNRLAALGAALIITAGVIVVAELGGLYVTHRAEVAAKPKPQEYIINLQTPAAHKVP